MSANDGAPVPNFRIKPWCYLQKGGFALKPKTQYIGQKKLGFTHPWKWHEL